VVGGDVSQITVSAPAADGGASVAVSGGEELQIGENEIVCTVTAPDGQTTKTYRIVVTKVEGEAGEAAPIVEQVALKTDERNLTVISAQEGMEIPEGFVQCSVTIDGQAVEGWVWKGDENPEYCIFYAINEQGEKGFYRYDLTEKTLQRYFRDPAGGGEFEEKYNATAMEYNSLLRDYEIRFWIIIGLIALAVALLIAIIILVANRNRKEDFFENREEDEWEPVPKGNNPRLSKREQYLRDMEEEEEEEEREEDYSFARRVQSDEDDRSYVVRGGAYTSPGQTGSAAGDRSGMSGRGTGESRIGTLGGEPQIQRNMTGGQGSRGTGPVGGTMGTRTRGSLPPARTAGGRPGGQAGENVRVRSTGTMGAGQADQRRVPQGETQAVPVSQIRGGSQAGSGGRTGNYRAAGTDPRPRGAMAADDDFEVIDLE